MLSKQIKQIRNQTREYQTHLWDFRFSGNTLELTAKPNYAHSSEEYRMGVMAIGQVLRAIENSAFSNRFYTQIHSFPSLDETQLIASIRLHKQYGNSGKNHDLRNTSVDTTNSIAKLIKAVASHYSLLFNPSVINDNDIQKVLPTIASETGSSVSQVYSLCTSMDNPFIWLKVGQWLEGIKILLNQNPELEHPVVKTTLAAEQRVSLSFDFENCSYCQALVVLMKNDRKLQDKKQFQVNG